VTELKGVVVHFPAAVVRQAVINLQSHEQCLWNLYGPTDHRYQQVHKLAGDMCFALNNAEAAYRDRQGRREVNG